MTLVATKPRPADPARMRNALVEMRAALDALPDHHDFTDPEAFAAAFEVTLDELRTRFRALDRSARITQTEEFCTIAGFGHVTTSRLGFIGALEKWLRRIGRAVGEDQA